MNIIQTNNLTLRHFQPKDAAFAMRLVNSPTWLQFIGDRKVQNLEDAEQYIAKLRQNYEKQGVGFYLVEITATQEPIGMSGVIHREGLENVDIGFALLPEFEGKGYAWEMTSATLQYARETLQFPKIVAITLAENTRCIRLLEKLGLRYEKMIRLAGDDADLCLFTT